MKQKRNEPSENKSRPFILASGLALIGFVVVALLRNAFLSIDKSVNQWTSSIHSPFLTWFSEFSAYAFDTITLILASFVIAIYLWFKGYRKYSLLFATIMVGGAILVSILKNLIQASRPLNGLMMEQGFSFPSGHTTIAVVFFGIVAYFILEHYRLGNTRKILISAIVLLAIVIGLTRIYLNVHWLSDVIGGYLVGIFWLTLSIAIFLILEKRLSPSKVYSKNST